MKQQINLYLPEFRVKKDPVSSVLMGQVVAGVVVVMVMVSGYDLFSRWQLQGELDKLQAQLAEQTRLTNQLDEQLARRSQNTELVERLSVAERRLESSRQIRDFLSETQLGNVDGFSEGIKDLARASFDGIALTQFAFEEGGSRVVISGNTTDSAMVPRYVNNFARGQSVLRGQRFSPKITRRENGETFSFELSNGSE